MPIPRGGYSLCDGWYICAAVLTPFFHFGRIEHDLFGVFFSSTNSKAIFWGTKTTNFYKNRSFWPQIQFFPRSFWVQFSAASGTPPSVFRPSTPPRGPSTASDSTAGSSWFATAWQVEASARACHQMATSSKLVRQVTDVLGPVSLTIFSSQFKCDGNFISLSSKFWWYDRYKISHMPRQRSYNQNLAESKWNFHHVWIVM